MSFLDNVIGVASKIAGAAASAATMAAMGPVGLLPAALVAGTMGNLVSQGVGQALTCAAQTLTQVAGMPKFIAGEVADLVGKVLDKLQPTGCEQQAKECCGGAYDSFIDKLAGSIVENAIEEMKGGKGGKGGGTSWFEALAKALGKALDAQAAEVQKLSDAVQGQNAQDNPSGFTDLQAASQRMSFMMSSADQVLKTLGEGLNSLARK